MKFSYITEKFHPCTIWYRQNSISGLHNNKIDIKRYAICCGVWILITLENI